MAAHASGGFNPSGGLTVVGNNDNHVSPYLKAWIAQGSTCVVGVIGEGTSKEVTANWDAPFEGESFSSQYRKIEGAFQLISKAAGGSGFTAKTALETTQIWSGNAPHSFTLMLILYALANAKKEVMDAIQALEEMAAPNLGMSNPTDQLPKHVTLNIGRNTMLQDCLIKSISVPMDGPRTKDGHLARAEITLQIETDRMLNRPEVTASYH